MSKVEFSLYYRKLLKKLQTQVAVFAIRWQSDITDISSQDVKA
jgi:hypothetical protein